MLNKSYNIDYSSIIINNAKSIEPSLEETITLLTFFELKNEIIEKIISLNKNLLNFIDELSGNTLLHIAVLKEKYDIIEILISKGHKINIINFYKETPLHLSIPTKNHRIINLLLEKYSNPNVKDINNITPMHIAAYIGDYKVIKLLLLYSGDAFIRDNFGKIPIDYAREKGYGKAIDALKNSIYRNNSARNNLLYHKKIYHKNSKSSMILPPDFSNNNSPNNSILQNYSSLTNNFIEHYSSPFKNRFNNIHHTYNPKINDITPNLYIKKIVSRTKSLEKYKSELNSNLKGHNDSYNNSKDLTPSQESLICHPDIHDSFPWTVSENGKIMIKVDMNKIEEDPDDETIIKIKFIDGDFVETYKSKKNDIIMFELSSSFNINNTISTSTIKRNVNNTLINSCKRSQDNNNNRNSYEFVNKFIMEQAEGEINELFDDLKNDNNSDSEEILQIIEPNENIKTNSSQSQNNNNLKTSESLTYTYSENTNSIILSNDKLSNLNSETGTISSITIINDEQLKANLFLFLKEINMENYTDILVNQGFDDVRLMVNQMNTGYALTDDNLKEVGITKAGDRAKILIRLQELSGGFNFKIPFNSVYYINKKEYSKVKYDFFVKALLNWLKEIKLGDLLENFYNNGYYSLELIYVQMFSKNPLTEKILEEDLNIQKLGYRTRLMNKIEESSKKFISELKPLKNQDTNFRNTFVGEACKCSIF